MGEGQVECVALTESEWSAVLATLPESPETALGWELSLVRRTVERIVAVRVAAAEALAVEADKNQERLAAVQRYASRCAVMRVEPSTKGLREALGVPPEVDGR